MFDFYRVLAFAGVLAAQYFFSTRNSLYWGGIIPVAFIGVLTWMFVTNHIETILSFILFLVLGLLFLIVQWSSGRRILHNKRNKELERIKAHDMK